MTNPIGDPTAVDELARLYRREADRIDQAYDFAYRRLAEIEWVGKRATETRDRVEARRSTVWQQTQQLRSLAGRLESHAAWMHRTIRELEDLESRIRAWAAGHPPVPGSPGPDSSLIGTFPPYCSFEWRHLARRLRAAGASF
jgi:hypothetical protein